MLPVELRVRGIPVSHQSRNAGLLEDWKERVRVAARAQVDAAAPVNSHVEIHVVYYYDRAAPQIPDEDNALKPIQDALQGIIYEQDGLVTDGTCRKRDLNGAYTVRRMSRVLAEAFVEGEEFVHIRVTPAPDPRRLTP